MSVFFKSYANVWKMHIFLRNVTPKVNVNNRAAGKHESFT